MEKNKRFELTSEKKVNFFGVEVFRIKVIKTFKHKLVGEIKKGEIGGWVDSLDKFQNPNNEVYGDAWVYGKCKVKIILCSKFSFEFQWQIDEWLKLEVEFKNKLKEKK